jgi:hypothetical protein
VTALSGEVYNPRDYAMGETADGTGVKPRCVAWRAL